MDNYCCQNVDNVDKTSRQLGAIKSTRIWGSLLVGVAHKGVAHVIIHQCMYSCRIWRMIGIWFESSYDGGRGNFSDVSIEGRGNYSYSGHAFWSRGCSNSRRSIFSSFLSAKGRKTGASTPM